MESPWVIVGGVATALLTSTALLGGLEGAALVMSFFDAMVDS
jgi:hypothetical protein